ncbi:MAG: penicillin-binding protein, partial [Archangium sp.]|nr:penicillin-binding protein [Archangium sp.]
EILRTYQTPYAAVVALEPATGRVLAMAEHSEARPELRGLCTKAVYPAASIFKIVTAAALLEAGVSADETVCFHGGKRRVGPSLLDDTNADGRCLSLTDAMGHSANVAFAKLTSRYLDPLRLKSVARALGFNRPMPFPVPAEPSLASIPDDTYSLALAGAGFGDVYLSPLHGAALAAVAATGGLWRQPVLFASDRAPAERVMTPEIAAQLTDMLEMTVTSGTARRIFSERGWRVPGAVGKTGSLADKRPFRDYTWFVGFAPKVAPRVAVAAVIVNEPKWRIRAPWLGREAMRLFLTRH